MSAIIDDKSEHCVPFILERLGAYQDEHVSTGNTPPPFFVGLQGVQGVGKTTLVEKLCSTFSSSPYNLSTVVLSIDDLYLPHEQQTALAKSQPSNPLVQHRGQPSTHDVQLGVELFDTLSTGQVNVRIPSYDKSAFNGAGDRRPANEWATVNLEGKPKVGVVIFEGWCVGFRALSDAELERKWTAARRSFEAKGDAYKGQLGKIDLESTKFVNDQLRAYDALTDRLAAFLQIDAEDGQYVYDWRREQETALRQAKGTGMTDEQVINFVNGYYPAYELYTDVLRNGIFKAEGRQLRLVVGKDRKVKEVQKL